MSRTLAAAIAAVSALAAVALLVITTLASLESGRCYAPSGDASRSPVHAVPEPDATTRCVRGPGAAATAAGGVVIVEGRVDPARLAAVSRLAFALEREAERKGAAPAWPQRMGLGPGGKAVAPEPSCVALVP